MVHLGRVVPNKDVSEGDGVANGSQTTDITAPGQDLVASVYGGRFAAHGIPKHEMPEEPMPREVAYRLIKSVSSGG